MAKAIAALQADLYIIHTPHGIGLSDAYAVYGNTCAAGNASWMGQWSEFEVHVSCSVIVCELECDFASSVVSCIHKYRHSRSYFSLLYLA